MKNIKVIIALCLLLPILPAWTQEVLDVLPVEGRNELFHDYLMEELGVQSDLRKSKVEEALATVETLQARQAQLRSDYKMLVGDLPEKTPLNDAVISTLEADGYKIDRVVYESRPNHHVTANFYYPALDTGAYPGILVTCGHLPEAKAGERYQDLCMLLAKNGFTALIVDPICQAERNQIINPRNGNLYYTNQSGTKAHSRLDVGAVLVGTSVMAYELWDNLRSIDYLSTRAEVDTSRIGCTGSSGGGQQATYISAYDERIKVAAVNSFIMNEPTLFATIGPQTGSQNLSYEGRYGIDHPEYITMFAPKPFMILAGSKDFFDTSGTHQTYAEARLVYEKLGVSEKIGYFEYDDEHGYWKPKREEATRWFRTWFYGDTTTITEPEEQNTLDRDSLRVTETGQVYTNYPEEKVVENLNVEYARAYASDREEFWSGQTRDSCLNKVRELIRLEESPESYTPEVTETYDRGHYTLEKIKLTSGNLTPVTGLMLIPKEAAGALPAVLYVDGRGKKTDAEERGLLEQVYVDSGKIVFSIDVRGFGETTDNPSENESKHGNKEHRNAVISLYIGKTLIGQRVEDIQWAMDYLCSRPEVDPEAISIAGIDRAGTAVLHAAALDTRFTEVVIRRWTDTSWTTIVAQPTVLHNMTHEIPSALKYYDLPDLVAAIAPRPVYYAEEPALTGVFDSHGRVFKTTTLGQNCPNPFGIFTLIPYSVSEPGEVSLMLFNQQGEQVMVMKEGFHRRGSYRVRLNAASLEPGVYYYRLSREGKAPVCRKMIRF